MIKHGLKDKPFWITEIGWWGTGSKQMDGDTAKKSGTRAWTAAEIINSKMHPREDSLRAIWLKDLFPKLLKIEGYGNIFLWCAIDEYEGGFDASCSYYQVGEDSKYDKHPLFDLWGIFSGDKQWKKSAYALQQIIKENK